MPLDNSIKIGTREDYLQGGQWLVRLLYFLRRQAKNLLEVLFASRLHRATTHKTFCNDVDGPCDRFHLFMVFPAFFQFRSPLMPWVPPFFVKDLLFRGLLCEAMYSTFSFPDQLLDRISEVIVILRPMSKTIMVLTE